MYEFKLSKQLNLDSGNTLEKLDLDFESLSFLDLKNAKKIKSMLGATDATDVAAMSSLRLDGDFRIGIAWIAAVKGTPGLSINDCLKLSARDAMELSEVALTEYVF